MKNATMLILGIIVVLLGFGVIVSNERQADQRKQIEQLQNKMHFIDSVQTGFNYRMESQIIKVAENQNAEIKLKNREIASLIRYIKTHN